MFVELSRLSDLKLKTFYGWQGATERTLDPGFGQSIQWDIPLLEGYDYEFVRNVAKDPGSHHFRGIDLPELCTRISQWQADAVLVYGWCYKSHLAAMRFFKGRKAVLFRGDSTLLDERGGVKTRLRRLVLRWVYHHVDVALSVGRNNREYFRVHGLADKQIVHAPHAVDNDRFEKTSSTTAGRLRESLGIPQEGVVFLFSGKLEDKKAPDILIESFGRLQTPDAHLVMVGSGPLEATLKSKARSNVHFLGFLNQTEIPSAYRAADLVVLPSRGPGETWGLVLNEAMACGRAVLGTDRVGSAVDLIQAGRNGWIVPADNVAALTTALQEAAKLGREGLASYGSVSSQIIQSWTIDAQADAIARAVRATVGANKSL